MIYVDGELYTFYGHFRERLKERGVDLAWVEQTMQNPDEIRYQALIDRYLYDKYFPEPNITLRVVVDEDTKMLVTVYYV